MKKVSRLLLLIVGVILGLIAAALLAVNLYVQSQATQARIQQELSQRLGTTLRIHRISVTPWAGLKLSGITMPQSDAGVGRDFLQADTFRLRIRFLSLFSRRLVIREISLVNPNVVWAQNASGKWRLPTTAPRIEVAAPSTVATPPSGPPPLTSVPEEAAPPAPPASGRTAQNTPTSEADAAEDAPFTPEVRRVKLTHGNFHFLDAKARPVATFKGVNFRSDFRNGGALRGDASIAEISLRNRFFLERLKSPVRYDAAALEFSQITARVADGAVNGHFTMNPSDPGSPFEVDVKFHDVQADRVVTDAGGPSGMVRGRIEGQLTAAGKTADANALAGAGEIYLRDGQVRQYSLLVALGQVLQIDELKQLKFDEAHVRYHIRPGVITIDELLLSSANIRLSATGTIGFDGKLRLTSQLALNETIRSQLFGPIRDNFQPTEQAGYAAVDFQVNGTVQRPKTNLMNKLVGDELKGLGGVIDSFFGGGKSDRAKAKKVPSGDPQPAPGPPANLPPASAADGAASATPPESL